MTEKNTRLECLPRLSIIIIDLVIAKDLVVAIIIDLTIAGLCRRRQNKKKKKK
jgi:hypothetical protein